MIRLNQWDDKNEAENAELILNWRIEQRKKNKIVPNTLGSSQIECHMNNNSRWEPVKRTIGSRKLTLGYSWSPNTVMGMVDDDQKITERTDFVNKWLTSSKCGLVWVWGGERGIAYGISWNYIARYSKDLHSVSIQGFMKTGSPYQRVMLYCMISVSQTD